MLQLELLPFQERCSLYLLEQTLSPKSEGGVTVKAPTGAGKTVILIDFIQKYMKLASGETAFIWFCPGQGELEEQSRVKMQELLAQAHTCDLEDALLDGFEGGSTTFINWELVTKSDNKALVAHTEQETLLDKIQEAQRRSLEFVIIVDEEHSHDTEKAQYIMNRFQARKIIRVSATAKKQENYAYYEIDEHEVIDSGLITKALYINENVDFEGDYLNETEYLLDLAEKKRAAIAREYEILTEEWEEPPDSAIRPLVIIQCPNGNEVLVERVESLLIARGYTYENGLLSKWMSQDKRNLDGLTLLTGKPLFLLIKQAIATGWDCPRAKILVKLRNNMQENFEIQTIGRLRRMPHARHYGVDLLDFCYLYTFDEEYKNGVSRSGAHVFELAKVERKDLAESFTLEKQQINRELEEVQQLEGRDVLFLLYHYLKAHYDLDKSPKKNVKNLESYGFVMDKELVSRTLEGKFITTDSILEDEGKFRKTKRKVDVKAYRLELLSAVHHIKTVVGISYEKMNVVLKRLFCVTMAGRESLLSLSEEDFAVFILNNTKRLREDFRMATTSFMEQSQKNLPLNLVDFVIPQVEFYRCGKLKEEETVLASNIYGGYHTGMKMKGNRFLVERLFEELCEKYYTLGHISWFYKNGDWGKQYFSLVYLDETMKQRYFFPDYIMMTSTGRVWILEGVGGDDLLSGTGGIMKNKFECLRHYGKTHDVSFAFMREHQGGLFGNSVRFATEFEGSLWKEMDEIFRFGQGES